MNEYRVKLLSGDIITYICTPTQLIKEILQQEKDTQADQIVIVDSNHQILSRANCILGINYTQDFSVHLLKCLLQTRIDLMQKEIEIQTKDADISEKKKALKLKEDQHLELKNKLKAMDKSYNQLINQNNEILRQKENEYQLKLQNLIEQKDNQILQLEEYELKKMKREIRNLQQKHQEEKETLQNELNFKIKENNLIINSLEKQKKQIQKFEKERYQLKEQESESRRELKNQKEQEKFKQGLEQQYQQIENEMSEAFKNQIQVINTEKQQVEFAKKILEDKNAEYQQQIELFQSSLQEKECNLDILKQKNQNLEQEKFQIEEKNNELSTNNDELRQIQSQQQVEIKRIRDDIDVIRRVLWNCRRMYKQDEPILSCLQNMFDKHNSITGWRGRDDAVTQQQTYEIYSIQAGEKFKDLLQKKEFFKLKDYLETQFLGEITVEESAYTVGVGSLCKCSVLGVNQPHRNQMEYLLLKLFKSNEYKPFQSIEEVVEKALNNVICKEMFQLFQNELKNRNYDQNFNIRVAQAFVLKHQEQYFYCENLENGRLSQIDRSSRMQDLEKRVYLNLFSYFTAKFSDNEIMISDMRLIGNLLQEMTVFTKYWFLTEFDTVEFDIKTTSESIKQFIQENIEISHRIQFIDFE